VAEGFSKQQKCLFCGKAGVGRSVLEVIKNGEKAKKGDFGENWQELVKNVKIKCNKSRKIYTKLWTY
jgi:hypothetical protein